MKSLLRQLRTRRLASTFTVLITLTAGILIGSIMANGVHCQDKVNSSDAAKLTIPNPINLSTQFTKIAAEVSPAVVNISTETVPKQSAQMQGGQDNNGMQQFFQHFFGMGPGMGSPDGGGQVREALGSGFIVDPRGYIITNYHVIKGATSILVKLKSDPPGEVGGRPATVVGYDKDTDLAVIKINTDHPLPTVKLGNSNGTQVGEWVIAIGSPLALTQTVTAGIISAKDRDIEPGAGGEFKHYLQTDAAINPGNSGGPLVNMAGQVIGVNTAIYTETGGFQGMGFAMPSNTVINVYNQLIGPDHRVVRGSIGINFEQNLPPAVAHVYGFTNGVLISGITPGAPADKAGLKPGDIIQTINGQPVKNGDELINVVSAITPGTSISVGYVRNGKHLTAQVGVISRRDLEKMITSGNNGPSSSSSSSDQPGSIKLGLTVSDLPQGAPANLHGVLIQSVEPGSFADTQLGLTGAQGMVIIAINTHPIHNVAEFRAIISGLHHGEDVALELVDPQHADAGVQYVGGTLP